MSTKTVRTSPIDELSFAVRRKRPGFFALACVAIHVFLCGVLVADGSPPANAIVFGATDLPAMPLGWPGTTVNFNCDVTNSGSQAWGPNHHVVVKDGNGTTVASAPVNGGSPGWTGRVSFSFALPTAPGAYVYHLQGLEDGLGSFGDLAVTISVAQFGGAVHLAAGYDGAALVDSNGRLWMTGARVGASQLDVFDQEFPVFVTDDVVQVARGATQSLIVKRDGSLWFMGMEFDHSPGLDPVAVLTTPVQVATDVVGASAGAFSSYFIKRDGTLWGWGRNQHGEIGDGTKDYHATPVQIATEVQAVAAGFLHLHYLKADGTLWGVGLNQSGIIGNGTTVDADVPVQVATNVKAVYAGANSDIVLFIKDDGSLWALGAIGLTGLTGQTNATQLTPLMVAVDVVSAAAGSDGLFYLRSDGSLFGAGGNAHGKLGLGYASGKANLSLIASNVARVSTQGDYCILTKRDGSVWGMGLDASGQLGNGPAVTADQTTPVNIALGNLIQPPTPTGVAASNGTNQSLVSVTWMPMIGASEYEVWRGITNSSADASLLADHIDLPLFFDRSAVPGVIYYYWIKSKNAAGSSSFSDSDIGYLAPGGRIGRTPTRGDFNGDGQNDILWQDAATGSHGLWLMNGTVPAGWIDLPAIAVDWRIVGTGDFNGDGQTDILWENVGSGDRGIWIMNGTVPTAWINLPSIALDWRIVGTGDFNGDGQTDILWENVGSGDRGMWIMNGTVPAAWINLPSIALDWRIVGTGDFNGDGMTDILWENIGSGDRGIWIMNGTVPAAWVNLPSIALNWQIAGTGDFNGDGQTDILWENVGSGDRGIWIMNGMVPSAWINLPALTVDWRIAQ